MRTFLWPDPRRVTTFLGLAVAVSAVACTGARDASTRPCAPAPSRAIST
ncbi:hypothetical protein [Chondromyces apiculatus]|uniref:Uncharacterized protein n=1 Tax=Chondromyces apiculatus DSM 436 TaxID=1192034 RepID=A0A017TFX4_9BACT|nr:hypothetical protein [Chondromyces apiculatus]EYF08188.1 Hypothetical protein CAP_5948 [Chondromyces apiculatus DSM 436]